MKKLLLLSALLFLMISIPVFANAGLVPCGNTGQLQCTINDFFVMLARIYSFLVKDIAAPLAIFALTIGGVFILISAGNPNLMGTGKKIVYVSIVGLVLVFCSWLIIDLILGALGYGAGGKPWWQL